MDQVIISLNAGRLIEAIKQFRATYGVGLKEAKEACEAMRAAYVPHTVPHRTDDPDVAYGEHVVLTKGQYDSDYTLRSEYSRAEALAHANSVVSDYDHTIVCRVISRAVTTRRMQDVI